MRRADLNLKTTPNSSSRLGLSDSPPCNRSLCRERRLNDSVWPCSSRKINIASCFILCYIELSVTDLKALSQKLKSQIAYEGAYSAMLTSKF